MMKVPINDADVLDLDAPSLPAYETEVDGLKMWLVWCKYCRKWHGHDTAEGHHGEHCNDPSSPYWRLGYNLSLAGPWRPTLRRRKS